MSSTQKSIFLVVDPTWESGSHLSEKFNFESFFLKIKWKKSCKEMFLYFLPTFFYSRNFKMNAKYKQKFRN